MRRAGDKTARDFGPLAGEQTLSLLLARTRGREQLEDPLLVWQCHERGTDSEKRVHNRQRPLHGAAHGGSLTQFLKQEAGVSAPLAQLKYLIERAFDSREGDDHPDAQADQELRPAVIE